MWVVSLTLFHRCCKFKNINYKYVYISMLELDMSVLTEGIMVLVVFAIIGILILQAIDDKHWAWVLELSIWKR